MTDRQSDKWTEGQRDALTDSQTNGQKSRQTHIPESWLTKFLRVLLFEGQKNVSSAQRFTTKTKILENLRNLLILKGKFAVQMQISEITIVV